tara:strand:- start:1055 stop:1285 length:231 start_codon:yes stop_codon:yes gene_type:complete
MKIKMIMNAVGSANASGNASKTYEKDEIMECNLPWQKDLARTFVDNGLAMELKMEEVKEKKKTSSKKVTKKKATKK